MLVMKELKLSVCIICLALCGCNPHGLSIDPERPEDIGEEINTQTDITITPYSGETAADLADDVVDLTDPDIYWEANDFTSQVSITFDGTDAAICCNNDKILFYKDGAYVAVDFQTNDVSGVSISLQGTTSDGGVKIYGSKKFKLILNGVDITSTKGPAINDQCHKRVFVHLSEGSTNRLADASTYSDDVYYIEKNADEDRKGCLFSEGNVIVSGSGVLIVDGYYKHGICTDGALVVRHGPTIAVEGAAKNAIHVKGDEDDGIGVLIKGGLIYTSTDQQAGKGIKCDYDVAIEGGTLLLNTSGDAYYDTDEKDTSSASCIKSDRNISLSAGTITCTSTGTAGKGVKADSDITIGTASGGPTLSISTSGSSYGSSSGGMGGGMGGPGGGWGGPGGMGGSSSSSASSKAKAIKAEGLITINGGDITVTTAKDGAEGIESKTKSKNSIVINGGEIYMKCYDDCINSAGEIVFNGGSTYAWSTGNDSVDSNYGATGAVTIAGGTLLALSAKGSPEEGIDADNASLKVSGGYVFTMGAAQSQTPSVPTSSTATQPTALLKSLALSSGQYVSITDSDEKVIFTVKTPFSINQNYSMVTCPEFVKGGTYYVKVGSSAPQGVTGDWHGFSLGGTVSGATTKKTIKFTSNYVAQ